MFKTLFIASLVIFAVSAITPIVIAMWLMAKGEEIPLPFKKARCPPHQPVLRLIRVAQLVGALAFLGVGVFAVLWIRNS